MKRVILLFAMFIIASFAFAQTGFVPQKYNLDDAQSGVEVTNNVDHTKAPGDIIFYEDFNGAEWSSTSNNGVPVPANAPAGWEIGDLSGNGFYFRWSDEGPRGIFTNPEGPNGDCTQPNLPMASSTAANGFLMLEAEWFNTAPDCSAYYTDNMDSYIEYNAGIDFSAETAIHLVFEQNARFCCGYGADANSWFRVSTDNGATWSGIDVSETDINVATGELGVSSYVSEFDISPSIAGESNVWFRFHMNGLSHYFWTIDDIAFFVPQDNDIKFLDYWNDYIQYRDNSPELPISTSEDFTEGFFEYPWFLAQEYKGFHAAYINFGGQVQTNFSHNVELWKDGELSVSFTTDPLATLAIAKQDTTDIIATIWPWEKGDYNFTHYPSADGVEGETENDTLSRNLRIGDSVLRVADFDKINGRISPDNWTSFDEDGDGLGFKFNLPEPTLHDQDGDQADYYTLNGVFIGIDENTDVSEEALFINQQAKVVVGVYKYDNANDTYTEQISSAEYILSIDDTSSVVYVPFIKDGTAEYVFQGGEYLLAINMYGTWFDQFDRLQSWNIGSVSKELQKPSRESCVTVNASIITGGDIGWVMKSSAIGLDIDYSDDYPGLTFQVKNSRGNLVEGAMVELEGYGIQYTNSMGTTTYNNVIAGSNLNYSVIAQGHDTVNSTINNYQQGLKESVTLNNIEYDVTFNITDGTNPLEGVTINFGEYGNAVTNADGNAFYTPVYYETNINYSTSKVAYDGLSGTLAEIVSDTLIELEMNLAEYVVEFFVSDGANYITGASVTLEGQGTKVTDAFGYTSFSGIGYTTDLSYQVAANSYDTISDIIDVLASDITENITMVLTRYDVTFTVTDGANPIEGATISLTGSADQTTDVNGQVVFTQLLPATDIAYSVNAPGYLESSGTLSIVDSDVVENVQLDPITYQVTFVVDDGVNVLSGAEVSLSGYGTKSTNASGEVFFNNVLPAANISYNVLLAGYFSENGTVTVSTTDKNVNVSLSENTSTYRVEFNVTDGSGAIANAIVMLDGYGSQTTNAFGEAIFNDVSPESGITYLVTANNYNQVTGTVDVIEQDVTKQVTMELIAYSVTFTVTDGTSPVDGADVSLSGYGLQTTDVTGQAIFTEVVPEADIAYIINKTDFEEYTGTITVINSNVSIDLRLTPVGLNDQFNIEFSVYPNPSNGILNLQIAGEAQVKIMNMSGAVVYNNQIINKQAIDVSNLNSGVYVMQIRQKDHIALQRIIMQ